MIHSQYKYIKYKWCSIGVYAPEETVSLFSIYSLSAVVDKTSSTTRLSLILAAAINFTAMDEHEQLYTLGNLHIKEEELWQSDNER